MFPNAFSISEDEESGNGGEDGAESADFKKPITTKAATDAAKKYVTVCQARLQPINILHFRFSATLGESTWPNRRNIGLAGFQVSATSSLICDCRNSCCWLA